MKKGCFKYIDKNKLKDCVLISLFSSVIKTKFCCKHIEALYFFDEISFKLMKFLCEKWLDFKFA